MNFWKILPILLLPFQGISAAPGGLDTTFNGTGKVVTNFGDDENVSGVALQDDGKIVVVGYVADNAGSNSKFLVARYKTNGKLDTTFNGTGKVTTGFNSLGASAFGVRIQKNGKIVVVGESVKSINGSDFAVARYNSNGTLDTSFSGDGKVTIDFGTPSGYSGDRATHLAILDDQRILVSGTSFNNVDRISMVRFNTNGTLDNSFNGTGKMTVPIGSDNNFCSDLVVQSDDKILIAGGSKIYPFFTTEIALLRYNANGTPDTTFNGTGKVSVDIADGSFLGLELQNDGKIMGLRWKGSGVPLELTRYKANGTLDTSFNGTGKVVSTVRSKNLYGCCMAIQGDGKVVVSGSPGGDANPISVARYRINGTRDTSFGTIEEDPPFIDSYASIGGTAWQTDGRIVVFFLSANDSDLEITGVRYNGLSTTISGKVAQTISFRAPKSIYPDDEVLVATATSGLTVKLSVISGPGSISGNTLTVHGTGEIKIRATQNGNSEYAASAPVERTITVVPAIDLYAIDGKSIYGKDIQNTNGRNQTIRQVFDQYGGNWGYPWKLVAKNRSGTKREYTFEANYKMNNDMMRSSTLFLKADGKVLTKTLKSGKYRVALKGGESVTFFTVFRYKPTYIENARDMAFPRISGMFLLKGYAKGIEGEEDTTGISLEAPPRILKKKEVIKFGKFSKKVDRLYRRIVAAIGVRG